MPFKEHPEFVPPDSTDAKIWRYMDLAKFLSVLDCCSLYFARLDRLSEFDPFEGYYTEHILKFEKLRFEDMPDAWKVSTGVTDKALFELIVGTNRNTRELVKYHRTVTFVNSWHIKDHESAAMWKIYLSNSEGIAIQSTYRRLIESMALYADFDVNVGRIKYIDYATQAIPMGNLMSPFVYKRKSFEYEDELRALIWTVQDGKNDLLNPANNKYKDIFGINVPIDVDMLIEKIYVAPTAPHWIADIIRSVSSKYGLKSKEVVQSDLASKPVY